MATKAIKRNDQKGVVERVVEAAADAAQELGVAATSFKQTLKHVSAARAKAKPATTAVKRVASRAVGATTKAAKAIMPKRSTTKSKATTQHKTTHKSSRRK
ncbi:MAG TPA: hypothetical protein VIY48_00300 [Candidatus Paceibacterota bacterium]